MMDDTGEEEEIVFFEEKDVQEGIEECEKSLMGRIVANQQFNPKTVETIMKVAWGNPQGLRVQSTEGNRFYFFFDREMDMARIIEDQPWIFKNYLLILKKWSKEDIDKWDDLDKAPFWFQCWGIPIHCQTIAMGGKLGEKVGKVMDVGIFELPQENRRILKFKAEIDISKPLKKGIWAKGKDTEKFWVEFRMEKLPMFCKMCGLLGHGHKFCDKVTDEIDAEEAGEWRSVKKAGHHGTRVGDRRNEDSTVFSFGASTASSSSSGFSFGASTASSSSSSSGFPFGASTASASSSGFSFGASTSASATSSPMGFGSSNGASPSAMFPFNSAAATSSTQPVFPATNSAFTFNSAPSSNNNDQMSMEDSMAEDTVQATPPAAAAPIFGQQPASQSNFAFGAQTPSVSSPFHFGSQQNGNVTPPNPSLFQASGSIEFNAGGSFSLGTGGDKSGRRILKVERKHRKK